MAIKLLYDNSTWINSDKIKSINIIKEIDITRNSAPTTIADITLQCDQIDDLDFKITKHCDIYDDNTVLFKLYVEESQRSDKFEWKLSLNGILGYASHLTHYGDVYSEQSDYLNKPYYKSISEDVLFDSKYSYLPSIETIQGIIEDINNKFDFIVEYDDTLTNLITTKLHKVGLNVLTLDLTLMYINFMLNSYITDDSGKLLFKTVPTVTKNIPADNIINDVQLQYIDKSDVSITTYRYECMRPGRILFVTHLEVSGSTTEGIKVTGSAKSESWEWWCNVLQQGTIHYQLPTGDNYINVGYKQANIMEFIYEAPICSHSMGISILEGKTEMGIPIYNSTGLCPVNPNYSPIEEQLYSGAAAKYMIETSENYITIENSIPGEVTKIENTLLSQEWFETIKKNIIENFSYNSKCILKIVERPLNLAMYGKCKFGLVKYGTDTGDTVFDIGDKVKLTLNDNLIEGYITKMTYNLNGNIRIKECEITYNRGE